MSATTGIAWATHTASPWFGCTEVSPGCANCYARQLTLQKKWAGWGDSSPRVRSKGFWKDAYTLDRKAAALHPMAPRPRMFTSLMDWLDAKAPIEWLADFLKVVHDTPNLDWLLLTKRPENWARRIIAARNYLTPGGDADVAVWLNNWLPKAEMPGWPAEPGLPPSNVWLGVTVENQAMADKRIPLLLGIPAKVRWLSVEPLLGPVNLNLNEINYDLNLNGPSSTKPAIRWVVVGGESGSKRRDCGVEAIVSVAEQCQAAGVPCFVKQDCAARPGQQGRIPNEIWTRKEFPGRPELNRR